MTLKQEVVNLKTYMKNNMLERGQVEQYKQNIEEGAKRDLVKKLRQVNLFLQVNLFAYNIF
jgi:hypothetical protein